MQVAAGCQCVSIAIQLALPQASKRGGRKPIVLTRSLVSQLIALLTALLTDTSKSDSIGYVYAALLPVLGMISSVFLNHHCALFTFVLLLLTRIERSAGYQLLRQGGCVRSALMSMIYSKCLRLNAASRNLYTTGQAVNLLSGDTERVWEGSCYLHVRLFCASPVFKSPLLVSSERCDLFPAFARS